MTNKTRRLLFWLAMIVFLIITPLIVSYARGYRFDFTRLEVIQVGAFFLDSEPEKALVYFNGVKTRKETPVLLSGLFPFRTYSVGIQKEGYRGWQKKLLVQTSKITRAENIILPPEEWLMENYFSTTTPLVQFFVSPNGRRALVWTDTLRLLDVDNEELSTVLFPDLVTTKAIRGPVWTKNGEQVVFERLTGDNSTWYLFNTQTRAAENLNSVLDNQAISQIEFSPNGGLFVLADSKLFFVDSGLEEVVDLELNGVGIFAVGDNRIFALTNSNTIVELSLSGEPIEDYGALEFIPASLTLSPDNKKLAYISDEKLGILWVRDAEKAPFLKTGAQEILLEEDNLIESFAWHKESNHFFAFTQNSEFIFGELDGRGERNIWRWDFSDIREVTYSLNAEKLWFLTKNGVLLQNPEKF